MRERETFSQDPSGETIGEKTKKIGKEVVKWSDRLAWGVLVTGAVFAGVGVVVPFFSTLATGVGVDIGRNYFVKDRVLAKEEKAPTSN